jgi:2-dehydropantoate 2-reductase
MRLVIVGCGALGSIIAAHLSSLKELVMLGHWPAQISMLGSQGLTMIHPGGNRSIHTFAASDNPLATKEAFAALVLVKSYQTEQAAHEIKQFLAADGLAITLQNGLGNVDVLAQVLGPDRVTQGVTALGATMLEPGLVHFAGRGPTHLARSDRSPKILAELVQWMNESGLDTFLAADLDSLVWGKLAINTGINPLTALLRVPNGYLATNAQACELMCAAAAETAAVAKALNIELPFPDVSQRVIEVALATAENRSSMLQDVLRGSQTEIDSISGAVAKWGRSSGIPTPVNNELSRLVRMLPDLGPNASLMSELKPVQALLSSRTPDYPTSGVKQ